MPQEEADLIGLLHGSVAELHTHEAALSCLRCIHRALSSDGLLVLEMLHPKEIFTGTFFEASHPTACMGHRVTHIHPLAEFEQY